MFTIYIVLVEVNIMIALVEVTVVVQVEAPWNRSPN
jgi:hypothetical protein